MVTNNCRTEGASRTGVGLQPPLQTKVTGRGGVTVRALFLIISFQFRDVHCREGVCYAAVTTRTSVRFV